MGVAAQLLRFTRREAIDGPPAYRQIAGILSATAWLGLACLAGGILLTAIAWLATEGRLPVPGSTGTPLDIILLPFVLLLTFFVALSPLFMLLGLLTTYAGVVLLPVGAALYALWLRRTPAARLMVQVVAAAVMLGGVVLGSIHGIFLFGGLGIGGVLLWNVNRCRDAFVGSRPAKP